MTYNKGDIFVDKVSGKMYMYDGTVWLEIVYASYLKDPYEQ